MLIKEKSERNTLEMVSLEGGLFHRIICYGKLTALWILFIFMILWKTFIVRITGVPALIPWSCLRWSSSSTCMESHPCGAPWRKSI